MRVKKTLVAAALAGLTTMLLSGPAAADVIKVSPGDSIQAAIDKADPGRHRQARRRGPTRRTSRSRRKGSR